MRWPAVRYRAFFTFQGVLLKGALLNYAHWIRLYIFAIVDGAVRLKLAGENDVLFVEQGKTFTINLECMDEDGDVAILGNSPAT